MRTAGIEIRVQPTEKEAFQDAAQLAGISLSSWIRERLRRIAAQELAGASRPVPFLATTDR